MTFSQLAIGSHFKFANGVASFNAVCRKVSARCYTWHGEDGRELRTQVGSIKVSVAPMTVEFKAV